MITRDPAAATSRIHDLVVVGGGVYGAMLTLEAARRGLRPLLVERNDFGAATSWNSLRIVHGGLRYLQSLDLRRFRESVTERNWFLRNFPDLVEPLPCLMPLYQHGVRRTDLLGIALRLNDRLSRRRNRGVRPDRVLPDGRLLTPDQVRQRFPSVGADGLRGGALWFDAVMRNSQRLLIEALHWAASYGAAALNYVEATELVRRDGRVAGLRLLDRVSGEPLEVRAETVVNCAGPWSAEVAGRLDGVRREALFRPSLAFNVLLDREPLSDLALAVTARRAGARTFFMYPWRGRVLAGTYHAPWSHGVDDCTPGEELLERFLSELSEAVPGWAVGRDDVLRVFGGLLPAARPGTERLAVRPVVLNHAREGGTAGMFSVSGVKFTTARRVAEDTLRTIHPKLSRDPEVLSGTERPMPVELPDADGFLRRVEEAPEAAGAWLRRLIADEAVVHLDDLLLRRTDWGQDPRRIPAVSAAVHRCLAGAPLADWPELAEAREEG